MTKKTQLKHKPLKCNSATKTHLKHKPLKEFRIRDYKMKQSLTTLLWECEHETHTPEMRTWKSFRTPESSEFDCKGQNISHWGVLYIIGKILNCRCPKWACMTHLNIYNTSYGQKKGRESNWQFDSWPWEVGNRPNSLACKWHATRRWKALNEGYNFGLNLIPIGGLHQKL
jgi:hypothetical protein